MLQRGDVDATRQSLVGTAHEQRPPTTRHYFRFYGELIHRIILFPATVPKTEPSRRDLARNYRHRHIARFTMNVLFLVGFMGAGKTSVARTLAQRLGWRFYDLDDEIERRAGCTIGEIFRKSGEAAFRRLETESLRDLLTGAHLPAVIALGGGAVAQAENASLIDLERTVFLDAPLAELWRRCQEHETERPLRQDLDQFRKLYEARRRSYRAAAITVQTAGKTVEQVAAEIAHRAQVIPAKEK